MMMMIGWMGTDALAAVQITQQWMYLIIVPIYAMAEASGILVGQAVGGGEFTHLNLINRACLTLSLGLVLPLGYLFAFTLHWDVIGLRLGGNVGMLVGALVLYWRWKVMSARVTDSSSTSSMFDTQSNTI